MNDAFRILAMVLGISLVILVHELGHYLAARWCRVRVDVFSLGFGPRLFAWRSGPTLYQVALLPLGGYVRMAGEEQEPGRAPAPYELAAKSVGQRFLIYSGGVLMNVLFAMVVFPIVLAVGVPMTEPVIGSVDAGGPAWRAGVQPGSRVLKVNEREIIGFDHIASEVALGPSDSTRLALLEPGAREPRLLEIPPVYSKGLGIYQLGVRPTVDRKGVIEVRKGSPAFEAGLRSGDRLLSVAGAPPEMPPDEQILFAGRSFGPIELRYERAGEGAREARIAALPRATRGSPVLGVFAYQNWISDLRDSESVRALGLHKDDRILSANGVVPRSDGDLLQGLLARTDATELEIERNGARQSLRGPGLSSAQALSLYHDLALRGDGASTRICVREHTAAEDAGLRDGDRIVALDGRPVARFEDLSPIVKESGGGRALQIIVHRSADDGSEQELSFSLQPRQSADPSQDYGINIGYASYVYQAPSPEAALRIGISSSWRLIGDSWLTLKRIATGQVSGDNVGGIITIGYVSYTWAGQGLAKLFYFLCMLSISLAFLNVLPIPVLDGGHLFFLVIEKIKGSPVSERVLSYSQIVGLVLIVSLVVYVTFNDIQRFLNR